MKRIYRNSDIKFNVEQLKGLTEKFIIKFYTTNKDFRLRKTDQDVVVDGGKRIIPLNWDELYLIGDGVLNYIVEFILPDGKYEDGKFNNTYSRTTDYYICSNVDVEPEEKETITEIIAEIDRVTAEALIDLKGKIEEQEKEIGEMDRVTAEALTKMNGDVNQIDIITALALNDLDERLKRIEWIISQ